MLQFLTMADTMIDKVYDFAEHVFAFTAVKPFELKLWIVDQNKTFVLKILGFELALNFWLCFFFN